MEYITLITEVIKIYNLHLLDEGKSLNYLQNLSLILVEEVVWFYEVIECINKILTVPDHSIKLRRCRTEKEFVLKNLYKLQLIVRKHQSEYNKYSNLFEERFNRWSNFYCLGMHINDKIRNKVTLKLSEEQKSLLQTSMKELGKILNMTSLDCLKSITEFVDDIENMDGKTAFISGPDPVTKNILYSFCKNITQIFLQREGKSVDPKNINFHDEKGKIDIDHCYSFVESDKPDDTDKTDDTDDFYKPVTLEEFDREYVKAMSNYLEDKNDK